MSNLNESLELLYAVRYKLWKKTIEFFFVDKRSWETSPTLNDWNVDAKNGAKSQG
jgi:hypothetical protein